MSPLFWVLSTYTAVLAVAASAVIHPSPVVIWNATASAPIGLYAVRPARPLRPGELVVVDPPRPLAAFLTERRYLPKGVPLIKHIVALPGAVVCRSGHFVTVDGRVMGEALDRDHLGRALPIWSGRRVLGLGEVFLMNAERPDSLDGRYFGPLPMSTIVGRAVPLWVRGSKRR